MKKCKDCAMYFRSPHNLCYLAEIEEVDGETKACEDFVQACTATEGTTSATNGDYSPSNPWDTPGMRVKDFI